MNKLIKKYFTEGLTEAENQELREWVASSKTHRFYFGLLRALYLRTETDFDRKQYNATEGYQSFLQRKSIQPSTSLIHLYLHRPFFKIAAAILVLCIIGYVAFYIGRFSLGRTDYFAVSLPNGKSVSHIVLPDGTDVDLNAASKLVYRETKHLRSVQLDGQAFFDVKHDANKKFMVEAGALTIADIGTRFDVDAYRDDSHITVFLAEGKVSISQKNMKNSVYLRPLDKVVFSKQTGEISISNKQEATQQQWIGGKLNIDNLCLSDLAKKLERFYNVNITLADPEIGKYSFYGSFDLNKESLVSVLETLSSTNKIQYRQKDSLIILRKYQ